MQEERFATSELDNTSLVIEYLKESQSSLMNLEVNLRDIEDSKEIIMGTLKAAGEFYSADRAYVLEADLDLRIAVNTYEWCAAGVTEERENWQYMPFEQNRILENAIRQNLPLLIDDIEQIKEKYPEEYICLKKQGIRSLIATPYSKRINAGLIAVVNPKKYCNDPSFLLLLSYVVVLELNEIKLQKSLNVASRSITEQSPNIVHINMFGGLEIISAQGILRDADFTSDQGCNLLTYLLFSRGSIQPVHKLCEINRLDADVDDPYNSVKGVVYRLRSILSYIGLQDLVQATHGTFIINPKYTIHTDVERFDEICTRISPTTNCEQLKGLYEGLCDLYKGSLLPWYDYFPWLIAKVSYYQNRYLEKLKNYIKLLNEKREYLEVQRIANIALTINIHDADFLYYSIMADLDLGNRNLARIHYKQADVYLTEEQKAAINSRL